ncbi:hypothetical protein NE237_001972 [Protea cynaroides]|uniref:Uncharacterized protein n=1 Tax=Protea cynaroides TaxID=273540 RepID=A0A9Q0KV57_9MAGN|nr:hypothetical protein NE237_001972 [Protea cynaroides]
MVTLMVVVVIVVFSITTLVSTFALHDHHHRKLFVGSIGLVVAIGMYGAPLVVVKQVVQTKSVEYMPFNLSLFSFLNSSMWGPYGLLGHDLFIAIPNLLGWPLALFQLVLYFIYKKRGIHEEPSDDQTDLEKMPKKLNSDTGNSMWGPYGLLGHDPFIAIPNLLGWPLSLFQLVLYFIYRKLDIHKEPSDDQADLEKTPKKLNSGLVGR